MRKRDADAEIIRKYGSRGKASVAIGIHQSRLSRVIAGIAKPTESELGKLSSAFGLRFCYGLGEIAATLRLENTVGLSTDETSN